MFSFLIKCESKKTTCFEKMRPFLFSLFQQTNGLKIFFRKNSINKSDIRFKK